MRITELFDNGEFVVSAEVGPPKGIHIDGMVEEAKKYLTGVHFVNVTDNQSSVMRLGSLATCKVLKDAGLNPIFQLTCRDRNRIALESDLLSAAMLGIDNILCLTGDHTKLGDHPQAKPVFIWIPCLCCIPPACWKPARIWAATTWLASPQVCQGRCRVPLLRLRGRAAGEDGAQGQGRRRVFPDPSRV